MFENFSKETLAKNYITKKQASELLDLSQRTIDRYVKRGNVKTITVKKIVYIDKVELERFVNEYYNR